MRVATEGSINHYAQRLRHSSICLTIFSMPETFPVNTLDVHGL